MSAVSIALALLTIELQGCNNHPKFYEYLALNLLLLLRLVTLSARTFARLLGRRLCHRHQAFISGTLRTIRRRVLSLWQAIPQIRSRFLTAVFFLARIPFVIAGGDGDDFSNNLLSDLAPLLTLFGEQVAKQYLSHSMGWVEEVIFAMAPLGIITAISGAIRVGGPDYLKAIIGRAREGKGQVELELMSSTSSNVCELWNGSGVSRIMGATKPAPIIELIYLEPDRGDDGRTSNPTIYDFHGARKEGVITDSSLQKAEVTTDSSLPRAIAQHRIKYYIGKIPWPPKWLSKGDTERGAQSDDVPPNLALNVGRNRVRDFEFRLVAMIGIALQTAVLVFAGLTVSSRWKGRFAKGSAQAQLYALPFAATGTIALNLGMFLCAWIIERSTDEQIWDVKPQVKVVWVQRECVVGDQLFESYFIRNPSAGSSTRMYKSRNTTMAQPKLNSLAALATLTSLIGFVAQFIGLRGLNWSVTVAQLLATGIMTALRAWVRRSLVLDEVENKLLPKGYELDYMARNLRGCSEWSVVSWESPKPRGGGLKEHGLATNVLDVRCRLHELSKWGSQWQLAIESLATAVENTLEYIFSSGHFVFDGVSIREKFTWQLGIGTKVDRRTEESAADGSAVSTATDAGHYETETIELSVSRKWLSEGRGWGSWKIDQASRSRLEAVLSLWMLHIKEAESRTTPKTRTLRIINTSVATYDQWIRREADAEPVDTPTRDESVRVFKNIWLREGGPDTSRLAVESNVSLEKICSQLIFSGFLFAVAKSLAEPIGGKVRVRGGERAIRSSFGLRNEALDTLAETIERVGLATVEGAFLIMIPPFEAFQKLPTKPSASEVFEDTSREISTYLGAGRPELAEPLLMWLLDKTESLVHQSLAEEGWSKAYKSYKLFYETCKAIDGGEDYLARVQESMRLFWKMRLMDSNQPLDGGSSPEIKDIEIVFPDWEDWCREWKSDPSPTTSSGENAAFQDHLGRTHLMRASISGNALRVAQILRCGNTDVGVKDHDDWTAIHHAAAGCHTLILHKLLLRIGESELAKRVEILDSQNGDGKAALTLAIEQNHGAAVALLVYYGASDSNGEAESLLKISLQMGSPVALKSNLDREPDKTHHRSCLHWSIWRDSDKALQMAIKAEEIAGQALDKKDKANLTPLHYAINKGRAKAAESLIAKGAKIELINQDGCSVLRVMASRGYRNIVKLLLDKFSIAADSKDTDGRTPLSWAAGSGHKAVVELLLSRDDVVADSKDVNNRTPLSYAAENGHEAVVKLLLTKDHIVADSKDVNDRTPLSYAAENGHEAVVKLLLTKDHIVADSKDVNDWTPLSYAAQRGHEAVVKLLLSKDDVAPGSKDTDGRTLLSYAAENGREAVVKLLLARDDVVADSKDVNGRTPLSYTAENGHEAVVKLLLTKDIVADSRDVNNRTPLSYAAQRGHEAVVELLLSKDDVAPGSKDAGGQTPLSYAAENGRGGSETATNQGPHCGRFGGR